MVASPPYPLVRPTPTIDPKILANMNMHGPVGYHANTLGHSRNVVSNNYSALHSSVCPYE